MKGIETRQLAVVLLIHKQGYILKKTVDAQVSKRRKRYWLEKENGEVLQYLIQEQLGISLERDGFVGSSDTIKYNAFTLKLTERTLKQLEFWTTSPPYVREMESLLRLTYKAIREN
ncbi:hypothetical protein CN495_08725 [Bacillus thuringiensis]|uniref:Uncharacterized protein n=1 Tax=Bacillus thuringiensis TaxID=1428 RepID=A0ABD6SA61_BACTU|nr:hypothetical protein [Bacillus thuringiensis]PER55825.1 hypothetical protein CN495_08725 [Bacillus thuringiensis]